MKTRTTQPRNNKYYIRQVSGGWNGAVRGTPTISGADVLCNCVGYANGRFNEIIGAGYCKYQLVCNAENFIEAAKRQGLKISQKPIQGGIMVWKKGATLSGGDGAGHVAVVEEVYKDGSILTSESGWASWAFKTVRRDNKNGRWGQAEAYSFRGCIINPAVNGEVVPTPKLTIDGVAGAATIRATQEYFGTIQDGILSGQNKNLKKYYTAITAVSFGTGGSGCVKKLQKWLGVEADGVLGPGTIKAWQKKLGVEADGYFGANSCKAWQRFLNENLGREKKKEEPAASKKKYNNEVIDVSYVQKNIDWEKVKADGIVGAIIRCGYRGYGSGKLCTDEQFENHIKGAHKAGLKIGVYFFTEAINGKEGKEEAAFCLNQIKKAGIPIDYPIAVDTEYINADGVRANNISKAKRTEAIKGFCEEIKSQGYTPMIYASLNWFDTKLNMAELPYKIWVAQYNSKCDYKGDYLFWQYTSKGEVSGIKGVVDLNKNYFKAPEKEEPKKENIPEQKKEPETTQKPEAKKITNELILDILLNKYGSGDARKEELTKAGYDYDAVQKRINVVMEKMRTRKEAMKPWFDACKEQEQWQYNAKYNWSKWKKTIASSKEYGTCITFPSVVAMRCGMIKEGRYITSTGSNNDSKATQESFYNNAVKSMASVNAKYWSSIKYPEKTTAELVKAGKIKEGDILGFMGHTAMYAGKDSKGTLLYNHAGHAAGIYDNNKAGSNRAVLNVKSSGMSKRKIYGVFSVNTFFIITECTGGSITPSNRYMAGQTAKITITPDTGKKITSIKVDGKAVAISDIYTISKIDAHHIIEVICSEGGKEPEKYPGKLPTLELKKSNAEVIADTIQWAKWIAGDNRFHYGYGEHAHHNGCYFCGTQKLKKGHGIEEPEYTYCCNPFVGAALAHGGCIPTALSKCQNCSSWDFHKGTGYDKSKLFTKLGHPKKSELKAGDVLCRDTHVALYIGDGKIAEAGSGDDNKKNSEKWKNSIRVKTLTDSNYKNFPRAYRYNGTVNTSSPIRHGEISDRVADLQRFIDWYYDNSGLTVDRIFGDATLAAVRQFQKDTGLTVDGIVGKNTIKAMEDARK